MSDHLWKKGCPSPNPKGRPKGSRNKLTQKELDYVAAQEGTLTQKLMKMSECGDPDLEFKATAKLLDFINSRDLNTTDEDGKSEYMELSDAELKQRVKELAGD
ncbi:DUF5681 domain-containing protein [Vibrio breoganii]